MALKCGPRVILVVEDDDSMRESVELLLRAAGFSTATYASAETMLAGGADDGALCVISDLNLPAMSGIDLLTELRRLGSRLPVIIITAHDSTWTRRDALRRGAAAYLAKPFPGASLLAAIELISTQRSTP
jgi:FixJ family two-component response regulator